RVNGEKCDRCLALVERAIELGGVLIEGAAHDPAELVVVDAGDLEALARVEDGEVDTELVHAPIKDSGDGGGSAVEGILGREGPEGGAAQPGVAPRLWRGAPEGGAMMVVDGVGPLEALDH